MPPTPPAAPTDAVAPEAPAAAASAPSQPTAEATLEQRFADWVAAFRASAQAEGIEAATLSAAFDGVRYLPRVAELDRAQPEFMRTVWDYLDSAVSSQRIARGRDKLQQVRGDAYAAAARYGVPPAILVAIWGVETNYGAYIGNTPTIDALATLGFDGRREAWARGELMSALKILQSGDIGRMRMIGSWAGAMGQTQFTPSSFLAYAVDADGDGRRDIWGSVADVMASTANHLVNSGWRAGEAWGVEVRLPPGFDVGLAEPQTRQSGAQWAADGVRAIDGSALPEFADGAILLPAGARGPAFLVGPNFRALLGYNNSTSYALAVGLLALQIEGGPGVQSPWPRDLAALSRSQVQALQTALSARGFDSGAADGVVGPATRDALRRYQRSVGVPADGYPTLELLQSLQAP
jgi:membrane-bound lytic murein transglycosylase B